MKHFKVDRSADVSEDLEDRIDLKKNVRLNKKQKKLSS